MMTNNPLLDHSGLPSFDRIGSEHAEAAVDQVLNEGRAAIEAVLAASGSAGGFIGTLETVQDRLNRTWSPIRHLHAVADNEPLRAAYNRCLPKVTAFMTELGQHQGLYAVYRRIDVSCDPMLSDPALRAIVTHALRDFRLSGIELASQDRERFKAIKQRLAALEARFEEQLLDATQGWKRTIDDPARLSGLPESARLLAAQSARQQGLSGWVFTLEAPSYLPVINYADDRALRFEMYQAYVTRASELGPTAGRWDNGAVMVEVLTLRAELARLLGYRHYADYSLVPKMAPSAEAVVDFLISLARRCRALAEQELAEIQDYAETRQAAAPLEAWDLPYYAEQLRQHRYAVSREEYRPYFPVPRVLQGLFEVVKRLYGIEARERHGVACWHSDVRFFELHDEGQGLRGMFYLDLYARPHKRGGAWMDECIARRRSGAGLQVPVAYLTCNFRPPVGDAPALLTHDEVETLFHEFGHGLQHLLTQVDYPSVAGINGVPWDAVELPSQFMENWCWAPESLALLSGHYQTGAPLDAQRIERLLAAKNFQAGMQMLRQIELALFDFRLHMLQGPYDGARIQQVLDGVRDEVALVKPPAFNRFQNGFAHIFAGGYAAGYYSYKWAEVLAADAFGAFRDAGIYHRELGARFLHTVLEQGGTRDPMVLFAEFRGREPRVDALLQSIGVAA